MRNLRPEAGEPAQQGGVGLSCKEPSTWDSCCWQAGRAAGIQPPELRERPGVPGKGESCGVMARGRGGRKGQGRKEGPGGHTQGIQCQGRPCVSALLDLAPPASPAASWLSPAPGTDFPQPQPAGAPWAIRSLPRSRRFPSGGGQAPHQQGQKRQEGH